MARSWGRNKHQLKDQLIFLLNPSVVVVPGGTLYVRQRADLADMADMSGQWFQFAAKSLQEVQSIPMDDLVRSISPLALLPRRPRLSRQLRHLRRHGLREPHVSKWVRRSATT